MLRCLQVYSNEAQNLLDSFKKPEKRSLLKDPPEDQLKERLKHPSTERWNFKTIETLKGPLRRIPETLNPKRLNPEPLNPEPNQKNPKLRTVNPLKEYLKEPLQGTLKRPLMP